MRCLIRSCCVLLCCLSLFIISSVPVSAETVDVKPYHVYIETQGVNGNGSWSNFNSYTIHPNNGIEEITGDETGFTLTYPTYDRSYRFWNRYYFAFDDGSSVLRANTDYSIKIEKVHDAYFFINPNTNKSELYSNNNIISVSLEFIYTDGTTSSITPSLTYRNDRGYDVIANFTPEKDVYQIFLYTCQEFNHTDIVEYQVSNGSYFYSYFYRNIGEVAGDNSFILSLDEETKTEGLLGGILNSLTSGLGNVFQGIVNVGNYIKDLPSNLLSAFGDWIKSVFQPSDEFMEDYRERAIALCEENFGALWEVVMIGFESWESINASDLTDSIDVPEVSIPLPDNNEFTFGGYNVRVVPEGFDFLATALKTIVGIVCSLAFVKGLRKRYDEIMEVDS